MTFPPYLARAAPAPRRAPWRRPGPGLSRARGAARLTLRVCARGAARRGRLALAALATALTLIAAPARVRAQELEPSANPASVIDFPTALDQASPNVLRGTLEVFDISAPDLRPANFSYGRQWNNVQLLGDVLWGPARHEFQYAEAKAKVRVLNFEDEHTYVALGAIARWSDGTAKTDAFLDGKPYSLLGVFTTELYPLESWGAFLVNAYLDNRVADLGLKVQLYQSIKFVSELDFHHGATRAVDRKTRSKAGLQFDGDPRFYMQLLYDDAGDHMRVQMGWSF